MVKVPQPGASTSKQEQAAIKPLRGQTPPSSNRAAAVVGCPTMQCPHVEQWWLRAGRQMLHVLRTKGERHMKTESCAGLGT